VGTRRPEMQPSKPNASLTLSSGVRRTLELLATGLYTHEVAERLCTDPDTVRCFVDEARAVLGVQSKLEAVIVALRLGLIDTSQVERPGPGATGGPRT
jgi:DNA-binding NarL/FixJ family response regulator